MQARSDFNFVQNIFFGDVRNHVPHFKAFQLCLLLLPQVLTLKPVAVAGRAVFRKSGYHLV